MREHATGEDSYNEPADGWVRAPELFDGVITTVVLCRWTGHRMTLGGPCPMIDRHPPGDCSSLYLQAEALTSNGVLDPELFEEAMSIVTRRPSEN